MSYRIINDNLYKEGSILTAKENPELDLIITRYFQRIYYCDVIGKPGNKQLVYFERELNPPTGGGPSL